MGKGVGMKIDEKTGRIAFHAIRFREDGTGSDLVQYDFDGSIESIKPYKEYNLPKSISS